VEREAAEAMDREDPLAAFRAEFVDVDDGSAPVYLDGNSLGRPSKAVKDAARRALYEWSSALVGGWSRWIDLPFTVGDRLGRILGAAPGQTVVCDNTTINLYKLASAALAARPERHRIVCDAGDFPTDRYVLQGLALATGRDLVALQGDPIDGVSVDEIVAALDDDTALLCLSHVNFRSGARLNIDAVTNAAHRTGALMLWDLCHSAGAVPVDLDDAGVDLAVGCTYKYLNAGPGAPAFLYVRNEMLGHLGQPIWGWFGQRDQFAMADDFDPQPGIGRFLTGTPSVQGVSAVDAALDTVEAAGVNALWWKSQQLTALLVELVRSELEPLGAALATPADPGRRGAHVSIAHPRAWALCSALVQGGLVVGDFRPPDVIRLGPAPLYTRFVEVFDAVQRIKRLLAEGFEDAPAEGPKVT
jgi:kynureninase